MLRAHRLGQSNGTAPNIPAKRAEVPFASSSFFRERLRLLSKTLKELSKLYPEDVQPHWRAAQLAAASTPLRLRPEFGHGCYLHLTPQVPRQILTKPKRSPRPDTKKIRNTLVLCTTIGNQVGQIGKLFSYSSLVASWCALAFAESLVTSTLPRHNEGQDSGASQNSFGGPELWLLVAT
jgi:hypothetical protein